MPSNPGRAEPVIVFDIGGTWFRSGIVGGDGQLLLTRRQPAVNYLNTPHHSPLELQCALATYLIEEAQRLSSEPGGPAPSRAAISLGACLNAHSGFVLNSGPLWGPTSEPFDLLGALRAGDPDREWVLVNDISAALLRHVAQLAPEARAMLVTVSTGIGCRIYDTRTQRIPLDRAHGIQGEIGHLPISFSYRGRVLERRCDCGGLNHLNAFASGRGIQALLPELAAVDSADPDLPALVGSEAGQVGFAAFAAAVQRNDRLAIEWLDALTRPLAILLVHALTFDPEIEQIFVVGGVAQHIGPRYLERLIGNMEQIGLYQISAYAPEVFAQRVRAGLEDDHSGLIGAALAARQHAAKGVGYG